MGQGRESVMFCFLVAPGRDDSTDLGEPPDWTSAVVRCWQGCSSASALLAALADAVGLRLRRRTARLVGLQEAEEKTQYGREQTKDAGYDVALVAGDR